MTKSMRLMGLLGLLVLAVALFGALRPAWAAESSIKFSKVFTGAQARALTAAFNTSTGHSHDGTDSKALIAIGSGETVTQEIGDAGDEGMIIYGAASQTADMFIISTSATAGTDQFRVDADGNLIVAGGASITGNTAGTHTGAVAATTLTTSGDAVLASGGVYASTFTATTGAMVFPGAVTAAGGFVGGLTGAASSNVLKAGDTMTGQFVLYARTLAQAVALAPAAVGASVYCSDCVPPKVLVGTGTSAGNWADAVGAEFK